VSGTFNVDSSGNVTAGSEDGFTPAFDRFLQFDGTSNSLVFDASPNSYQASGSIAYSVAAAPEPSSWTLALVGLGAICYLRRRTLLA
jgi:MYXO-CTERM domain-containing protein